MSHRRAWAPALVSVAVLALTGCGNAVPVAVVASPTVSATAAATPSMTPTPAVTPVPRATASTTSIPPEYEMTDGVLRNKLYIAGKVPTVRCVLARADLSTPARMVAHAKSLIACMDKAWAPMVEKADAVLTPPEVFAYSDKRASSAPPECADPPKGAAAYYHWSGFSGKICFDVDSVLDSSDSTRNTVDFQQMIAHEYGHHVQRSVGILALYPQLLRGKSEAGQLEVFRRKELQASCFGAAFLGANKATFQLSGRRLDAWRYVVRHVGDEYSKDNVRDHGSRKSHAYWTLRAFESASPQSCATFTAPAKRVS
ncbi:neutral zinc metallopeptidase [Kribbella sp. NPDC048915]|uniref:neutral zinc metallopeptidase n=1 Tax=Kribbella sp. NPDC048915 TaxID=3155148 RepID=UPI0033F4BB44